MPSNQLASLTQQIEDQNTDAFGKFYMYVSLLNSITVRDESFSERMSVKTSKWESLRIHTGTLNTAEFSNKVALYAHQFLPSSPRWFHALSNIALSYVRKGTLSDLAYIVDRMLAHLRATSEEQRGNKNLQEKFQFNEDQNNLIQFITQLQQTNKEILSLVDAGCNTALSSGLALAGLVLILASAFSIFPAIIGLGFIAGGAYAAYSYANQAAEHAKFIDELSEEEANLLGQINGSVGKNKGKTTPNNTLNYSDLFYSSIFRPLSYTLQTAAEQVFTDSTALEETRETLDKLWEQPTRANR